MTDQEVKEELERKKKELSKYRGYEAELKSLHDKIKELESRIRSIRAQQMTDMPQTPFTAKGGNEAINELVDLKDYYVFLHQKTIEECKRIEDMINSLDDPEHRALLRYRYINHLEWQEIADNLDYDKAHAQRIHKKILNKLKTCN